MGKYLIDNKKSLHQRNEKTVYDFLKKSLTQGNRIINGTFHVVTGYTTIGMLAKLYELFEENDTGIISKYEIVLGDLTSVKHKKDVKASFNLKDLSDKACKFLALEKVTFKTLEPDFCHGKVYIFRQGEEFDDIHKSFLIIGSSNLTERGLGESYYNNFELNMVFEKIDYDSVYHPESQVPSNPEFSYSFNWFKDLWVNEYCYDKKTVQEIDENDKVKTVEKTINEYLINQIKKDFAEPKTPKEIYLKVLYELFKGKNKDVHIAERSLGKLENSSIYKSLYSFQEKGALSLIKVLKKYNCAILGDAVGLGKTWTALAVMKFFRIEGYQVILFVPKRLRNNWEQYLPYIDGKINHGAKFVEDDFDFIIKNHTFLTEESFHEDKIESYFEDDTKKLIVIDESHNFRNSESIKYKVFMKDIMRKHNNIKVLMLSATPINTGLSDISNQFMLGLKDNQNLLSEELSISSINELFRNSNEIYKKWLNPENTTNRTIKDLRTMLSNTSFLEVTERLVVARTRSMIKKYFVDNENEDLKFIENIKRKSFNLGPENIGNLKNVEDIYNSIPKFFAAYKSSDYISESNRSVENREKLLVEMLNILLLKRLESSWKSFSGTVNKMIDFHKQLLEIIEKVKRGDYKDIKARKEQLNLLNREDLESQTEEEDDNSIIDGVKVETIQNLKKINQENMEKFQSRVNEDFNSLNFLKLNLDNFEKNVNEELTQNEDKHKSIDNKLSCLMDIIKEKQTKENKKLIIFTVYKDTVDYLFEQLLARGFTKIAKVTGTESKTSYDPSVSYKNFEPILQSFAPYTKLFLEKNYIGFKKDKDKSLLENYNNWQKFIKDNSEYVEVNNTLSHEIDILIATDCLSEGQNLQDSDMVINYDIHWNPVRVIQRMGRIDRLGSLNNTIYGYSFLPADNLESYLKLKRRVKDRMLSMALAGSETDTRIIGSETDDKDAELEDQQFLRMKEQMKVTLGEVEAKDDNSVVAADLSAERFENDLPYEMQERIKSEKELPDGIYSGFESHNQNEKFLIVLLRRKFRKNNKKSEEYHLLYLDKNSNEVMKDKKDILGFLQNNKNNVTSAYVKNINKEAVKSYEDILNKWINNQTVNNGFAGNLQMNFLNQLKNSALSATNNITETKEGFKHENFELVCWLVVG